MPKSSVRDQLVTALIVLGGLAIGGVIGWNWLQRNEPTDLEILPPAEKVETVEKREAAITAEPELAPEPEPEDEMDRPPPPERVSINFGTREELLTIPGITEDMADELLRLREKGIRIQDDEDLLQIGGITRRRLAVIIPHIKP